MSQSSKISFAMCGVFLACSVASAQDSIFPARGGQPVKGSITAMSPTEVEVEVGGNKRKIPANEIGRITYDGEPGSLTNVRAALVEKNFGSALNELKAIQAGEITRPELQGEVDYSLAVCLARMAMTEGGDKTAAVTALRTYLGKNKQHYRYYAAAELLGDLSLSGGDYVGAEKAYGVIVSKVEWPEVKARVSVSQGRANIGLAKYAEAEKLFAAVVKAEEKSAEMENQRRAAKVGAAVCMANQGKSDAAIKLLTDGKTGVIAETDSKDTRTMAQAYNALGTAYLKSGKKQEALLAFLHTDTLFFADSDAHAEALFNLGSLWADMQKSDRAAEAKNTLKTRYAGSVWAAK